MSQNSKTCYSTLSNMREYGHECYNSFDYFIYFSLSSNTYLYLFATQLSLSLLSGLHLSVAPYFFLTFIFLSLILFLSPSTTPHLCLESQELGLMDLPPLTLLGSLIWDGFDGSPTSLLPISFSLSFGMGLMGSNGGWLF